MKSLPKRRTVRLQGFDYGSENTYFVTICAFRQRHLFGEIQNGIICLNDLGAATWEEWEKTFRLRPHYISHAFQVMPNHLHGLISITRAPEDIWDNARIAAFGWSPKDTLATMIGGYKSTITSFARNTLGIKAKVWQSRFYDHVVRNQKEFDKISRYICNNTRNWKDDCFYS